MAGFIQRNRVFVMSVAAWMILSLMLSACSSSGAGEGGSSSDSKGKPEMSVTIYDRGAIPREEGTYEKNRWTQWINDNGPVTAKFVQIPRTGSQDKLNILMASGEAPDLILEYDPVFRNQLYNKKQILPLDDLIEKYSVEYKAMLEEYPILKKLAMKADGKMYEIGTTTDEMSTQYYLFIRKDWLQKLNLQMPTTTEELFQVAKAFTEMDPNGNGSKDELGINLSLAGNTAIDHMFGAVPWVLEGNQMVRDWERTKAANAYKKQLFEAGTVDKDYLTDTTGQKAIQDWVTGKLGIFIAWKANALNVGTMETLLKNQPNAEVVPLPLPKSKYGQYNPQLIAPVKTTGVINADAKNPEAVIKYIDFIVSDEAGKTLRYGIEGQNHKIVDGCPDVSEFTEINKTQLAWNTDYYQLLYPVYRFHTCEEKMKNLSTPERVKLDELKTASHQIYLSPDRPMAHFILPEYMPPLSRELSMVETNVNKPMLDIWTKAVIGGSSYKIDQAEADARSAWEKGGGKQLEDFYSKWYSENKDQVVLSKDLYTLLK